MTNPKSKDAKTRVPLYLNPPIALVHTAVVFREGATRPGRYPYNWRDNPTSLVDYIDATERHLQALKDGEWLDPKSGEPHAAHIATNGMIMMDADAAGSLVHDTHPGRTGVSELLKAYHDKWLAASETERTEHKADCEALDEQDRKDADDLNMDLQAGGPGLTLDQMSVLYSTEAAAGEHGSDLETYQASRVVQDILALRIWSDYRSLQGGDCTRLDCKSQLCAQARLDKAEEDGLDTAGLTRYDLLRAAEKYISCTLPATQI